MTRLVTWKKPRCKARTATKKLWRSLAAAITLRLVRYPSPAGFRTRQIILVTHLLDPKLYPPPTWPLYLRAGTWNYPAPHSRRPSNWNMLTCQIPGHDLPGN